MDEDFLLQDVLLGRFYFGIRLGKLWAGFGLGYGLPVAYGPHVVLLYHCLFLDGFNSHVFPMLVFLGIALDQVDRIFEGFWVKIRDPRSEPHVGAKPL